MKINLMSSLCTNPSQPPLTLRGGVPPLSVRGGQGELVKKGRGFILFLLFFVTACGSLEKGNGSSVAFDLPPALQTQSTADIKAFLLATNSEETKGDSPKELELTIADGKVSGTINLKPGLWTLELHFYQKAPSGSYLLVAMVSFGEKEVGEEGMELPYDPSQILFDDFNGTSPSIASPSVSLPENCSKIFDCDGDGFSNFEELKNGSDPEDAKSMPQKKSESVSAPVATTTTINKSSVTVTTPPTRVMDGLVGWWRFDDLPAGSSCNPGDTGQLTTADSSGNKLNGLLKNTPCWVEGVSGSALELNNTMGPDEDYVEILDNDLLDSPKTFEIWIYPTRDAGQPRALFDKYNGDSADGGGYFISLGRNDNQVSIDSPLSLWSVTEVPLNSWTHVVVTRDDGSSSIYLNGLKVASSTTSAAWVANTLSLWLGVNVNGNTIYEFFSGRMDEVAIYNRALSTAEIRNNCQLNDPGDPSAASGQACAKDDLPTQLTPLNGATLAPARLFLSWEAGTVPDGKNITHYHSCYTSEAATAIDGNDECANGSNDRAGTFRVLDSDSAGFNKTYYWKVQTCYDAAGTDCSDYSPIWSFSTDNSRVGWWKFYEGSGTTVTDSTGHGHAGNLYAGDSSPAWGPGVFGNAIDLDGIDDYVIVGGNAALDLTTAFSITAWVKPSGTMPNDTGIFSKATAGSYSMTIGANEGEGMDLNVYAGSATAGNYCALKGASSTGVLDSWHFLAGTFDSSQGIRCYLDEETGSQGYLESMASNSNDIWIGHDTGNAQYFNGLIDEVSLYNRALSAEEVRNNFCVAKPGSCQ
ncbi:MAG: LamG domain-containing protein [Deltaproteobacteria bacterium]|nr:LamG domain-containing protein [Deltaproteobacteria bacterium]